ncbi:MAG: hypothetical protein OXD43_09265 [Bacteroidetes bacterium]|nr:hypothetical protein [Bacteroidota bacterium]
MNLVGKAVVGGAAHCNRSVMNATFFSTLTALSRLPCTNRPPWLETARQGVKFLSENCKNEGIAILYAVGPHSYVRSFLVPRVAVDPPDHNDLANAYIRRFDSWSIERSHWGGKGYNVCLEPPLSYPGCRSLVGGEHTVLLRNFEGVKAHDTTIEVNQKLVHSLGLYYMNERDGYCQIDPHGDIERVIAVYDDKMSNHRVQAVTIRWGNLATYMAVTDTVLVTKFDFLRFIPGNFPGWDGQNEQVFRAKDIYYRYRVIPKQCSYAVGHIVLQTTRTRNDLIREWKSEKATSTRQYASFKILDRKNNRHTETSCGPGHIVNYYTDSNLPWEISPAFFRPEVLRKYKADPEKYTIAKRSINCRGVWSLKSCDINEAGQVHAYIGDLAKLPYEEQLYWRSFNEWPKGHISKRAFENDILGEVSSEDDPLDVLKELVRSLDRHPPAWWKTRGEALIEKVLAPATDSIEEWGSEILALDHLVVEGFIAKGLRPVIRANGDTFDKSWKALKLLEIVLSPKGCTKEKARSLVAPLKALHSLRNTKAHGNTSKWAAAAANARKQHGTLREHFQEITARILDSMQEIILSLPRYPG